MKTPKNTFKPDLEAENKEILTEEALIDKKENTGKKNKISAVSKPLLGILVGSFLENENISKGIFFLIFITFLGVVLIFNANQTNKIAIEINKTKREIKELRFNYISTKSDLAKLTRQSELIKHLEKKDFEVTKVPPKKIYH